MITKIIIGLFILFALGNAFFVVPVHWYSASVKISKVSNASYNTEGLKKTVLRDSFYLVPEISPRYKTLYSQLYPPHAKPAGDSIFPITVKVFIVHDVEFTALATPFYKVSDFNAQLMFNSEQEYNTRPSGNSPVLVSNMMILGKCSIAGICSPPEARKVIEKKLLELVKQQLDLMEKDINQP